MTKPKAAFVGRFSPMHYGHEWLIRQKLDQGIPCLILVRDMPTDEKNPFLAIEVKEMLEATFAGEDVVVQIIPNIESINYGRGVGYAVIEHLPPNNIKQISATEIRNKIKNKDDSWKEMVNPKTAEWLEKYYNERNDN